MSNQSKKVTCVIGILVGIAIMIVGFCLQDTSTYSIGEYNMKFGADFYTEIYDVTGDVGRAINYAINDLICAIGWVIISLGAIDLCYFAFKLAQCKDGQVKENSDILVANSYGNNNGRKKGANSKANAQNNAEEIYLPRKTYFESENMVQEIYVCPKCDNIVNYGDKKCKDCGASFDWSVW